MFEKEAIKYAEPDKYTEFGSGLKLGFEDGAEFGYNECKDEAKEIIRDLLKSLKSKIDWTELTFEEQEDVQTDIDIAERFLDK